MCKFTVVSANPGIDRTLFLGAPLAVGEVNRVVREQINAGSKGANVAAVLSRLGCEVRYVSFTGGPAGETAAALLQKESHRSLLVETACGIRTNRKLAGPDGQTTEINEPGGPVTEAEQAALFSGIFSENTDILVLSGSLPRGMNPDFLTAVIGKARESGIFTVVDASGENLEAALAAGVSLVKPNRAELCALLSMPRETDGGLLADLFREKYTAELLFTDGEAGAFFDNGEAQLFTPAERVTARGTVGAGDTFLAAYLAGRFQQKTDLFTALRFAATAAAVKVTLAGSTLPTGAEIRKRWKA